MPIEKRLKGEDGHKVFSIRIKDATVLRLDELAKESGQSRNELIGRFLDFAMEHAEIVEK